MAVRRYRRIGPESSLHLAGALTGQSNNFTVDGWPGVTKLRIVNPYSSKALFRLKGKM